VPSIWPLFRHCWLSHYGGDITALQKASDL
jgi:hypothetical protein